MDEQGTPTATAMEEAAPLLGSTRRRSRWPRAAAAAAALVFLGAAGTTRTHLQRLWTPYEGSVMPPDGWAGFSCELYDDDTRYPVAPWAAEDGDPATD